MSVLTLSLRGGNSAEIAPILLMSFIIPTTEKVFSITNKSDVGGNIWYTKNITFDKKGYIKLSTRTASLQSELDDSDFDIPVFYGRTADSSFNVITVDTPWIMNISQTDILSSQDTDSGVTTGNFMTYGCFWQNRLYQTIDTGLRYKSGSTWTNPSVTLTSQVPHPIEVFANRQTLVIGNGNAVKQINTSHTTSTLAQLTIPSDYEIVGLSYSSGKVGIITKLSQTSSYQNKEAMFFVWDGTTAEATIGVPCGTDSILAVAPYKSSWVIFTRNGSLLYFNGGGFTELASFPFSYNETTLGSSNNRINIGGASIYVDNDLIYINVSNGLSSFGEKEEVYIQNNPAGIWCYDPQVGLYHRYSPSVSKVYDTGLIDPTDIDTATSIITSSTNVPDTGNPVVQIYNTSDRIGGVTPLRQYYVIKVSTTTFKLATTRANAFAGTYVSITSAPVGTSTFVFLNQKDYGATLCQNRVGGIGAVDRPIRVSNHLLFGGEYDHTSGGNVYAHGCMTLPIFENRGYVVTPKLESNSIEDVFQKVYVKYQPLKTTDSIIVKIKTQDILGLPVTTPQIPNLKICTWVDANTFETDADILVVKEQFDAGIELECEVINGAGAGSIEKIIDIQDNGNGHTVTLENDVIGIATSDTSNVIINNWTKLGEITSADTNGYKEFSIGKNYKNIYVKCELQGYNTTIEQIQVLTANHLTK